MEQEYQFEVGQVRYLGIGLGVLEVQVDRRTMLLVLKWDSEGRESIYGIKLL
jgi:hypothetical protein